MFIDRRPVSKGAMRGGWIMGILPCLLLIMSATMKFLKPPGFAEGLQHMGWDEGKMFNIGIIELLCTALYLIPATSVFGAILLTGYLGGAIATHVRVGDPFFPSVFVPLLAGVLLWGGLFLRDPRIRELIPFRSSFSR